MAFDRKKYMKEWRANNKDRTKTHSASYYCKARQERCEYQKKWDSENKETKAISRRKTKLKSYGLTLEDYDRLASLQNGVCAICSSPCNTWEVLSVDHCHTTNEVRGLLCLSCNMGLGHFKDDVEKLANAIKYLNK